MHAQAPVPDRSARRLAVGRAAATVSLSLLLLVCASELGYGQSAPYVPVAGELLLRGRPAEGLLVLQSGLSNSQWVQADALVFLAGSLNDVSGDALVASLAIREPHGYGHARLGRFIMSTGAVRPVQIDGLSLLARAPIGSSLELFAGAPVVPEFGPRAFDWLLGARVGQQLVEQRATLGVSYVHRRDAGQVADDELGADLAWQTFDWLSLTALGAWDLTARGLAEARFAAIAHDDRDQLEIYFAQRVPSRLLPATSLFSVIGRAASRQAGAAASIRAFPRLELGSNAELTGLDDLLGYSIGLRSTLYFSDADSGRLSLEGTRRELGREGLTGGALQLWLPITIALRGHASFELVAVDEPEQRGHLWPWLRVGASYLLDPHWTVAAAVGVKGTPQYRYESYGLFRVGYASEVLP
jgi:hypothetical protein